MVKKKDNSRDGVNNKGNKNDHRDKNISQMGGGMIPRYSKIEFPTYDGTDDPLGWLRRCDRFFLNQRSVEGDKVGLAAFHLIGERNYGSIKWKKSPKWCGVLSGNVAIYGSDYL